MSLNHDFLLLDRETDGNYKLGCFIRDPRAIQLHDDLLRYMQDTLVWIPTLNPARQNLPGDGLNMWGPTVIDAQGAPLARQVFLAWADLFSCGPEVLELRGSYTQALDDDSDTVEIPDTQLRVTHLDAGYERLKFRRDRVARTLRQLVHYSEQVETGGGKYYLLHRGI